MPQQSSVRSSQMKTVLGSADNFWMWSPESGWDLSHPKTPHSELVTPRLHLNCYISNITIDPSKTAIVIIDMQNFSLSGALKPDLVPAVYQAQDALLRYAIPAARRAKIQVIWLNWGLTEEDLAVMNPGTLRVFDWRANSDAADYGMSTDDAIDLGGYIGCGERPRSDGLGADLGEIDLGDGTKVDAGRVLMKGTWNAALHDPLAFAFSDGQAASRPDVLIHKNRNSGMSDATTTCTDYPKREGIWTLLFTGMSTDQCVMPTLQDAHAKGFDTLLLKDACATDSPGYAQESAEYNCCRNWGFLSSCRALSEAAISL